MDIKCSPHALLLINRHAKPDEKTHSIDKIEREVVSLRMLLTQNMIDALTSYIYSVGLWKWSRCGVRKLILDGCYVRAGEAILRDCSWGRGLCKDTQRRRYEESSLFLTKGEFVTNLHLLPTKGCVANNRMFSRDMPRFK